MTAIFAGAVIRLDPNHERTDAIIVATRHGDTWTGTVTTVRTEPLPPGRYWVVTDNTLPLDPGTSLATIGDTLTHPDNDIQLQALTGREPMPPEWT